MKESVSSLNKQDKVAYAKKCVAKEWSCPVDSFSKNKNIVMETENAFFEIVTFGNNAVIRADKEILDWCLENYSDMPASEIMDGDGLYLLEKKMREHDKKLGGEYTRYLHLNPEKLLKNQKILFLNGTKKIKYLYYMMINVLVAHLTIILWEKCLL